MKKQTLKPIEIGYGEEKIIFYPRMISVAEQDEIQARLNDIADNDTEKYQLEYEICREALETFADKAAERLEKEKGEFKRLPLEPDYFAARTPQSERIVRVAYQLFLSQLQPDARFL